MDKVIDTKIEDFKLRFANKNDVPLILSFIKELAAYEKMEDEVVASEDILMQSLFKRKAAETIIGEYKGEPVGFVVFFHNFSTFLGKPGLYIEDIYVKPEMRGKGFGKTMFLFMAKLAVERDCGRMDWSCLDWNEPSIDFYKSMGAVAMDEWTIYRIHGDTLKDLSNQFK